MKAISLLAAFVAVLALSGYAKDNKCACKHKTANNKVLAAHSMAADKTQLPDEVLLFVPVTEPACYSYRKHNIVVTECPDTYYDNNSNIMFSAERRYSGYYPQQCLSEKLKDELKNDNSTGNIPVLETYSCVWNCLDK